MVNFQRVDPTDPRSTEEQFLLLIKAYADAHDRKDRRIERALEESIWLRWRLVGSPDPVARIGYLRRNRNDQGIDP